jgi:hypothetical protein
MHIRRTNRHLRSARRRGPHQVAQQRLHTGPIAIHFPVTYNQKLAHLSLPVQKAAAILTRIGSGDKEDPQTLSATQEKPE